MYFLLPTLKNALQPRYTNAGVVIISSEVVRLAPGVLLGGRIIFYILLTEYFIDPNAQLMWFDYNHDFCKIDSCSK
jgi:hypothetical protein